MKPFLPAGALLLVAAWPVSPAHAEISTLPDLTGLHVALDVGHSKKSQGAISARGRGEFYFNRDTTLVIRKVLETTGAKVTVINEDGSLTGLIERPQRAAKLGAHAFISIHHDSVNDKYLSSWNDDGEKRYR